MRPNAIIHIFDAARGESGEERRERERLIVPAHHAVQERGHEEGDDDLRGGRGLRASVWR